LEKPQKYEPIITACVLQANSGTAVYDACFETLNISVERLQYYCCFINLFTVHMLSLRFNTIPRLDIHNGFIFIRDRVAQSVYLLATGWTVRGSYPGGGVIFRTYPDRPWGPPRFLYSGYRVISAGKKRPGRDADPSTPSSAVVKKE